MLKKALANLSNDLDVLYDDALLRIKSQHQDHSELAEKALCWIAYSFRPFSADELQEALAINLDETDFDIDAMPGISLILDVCAGLLIHDEEDKKIRLVHFTAQDYFNKLQHSRFRDAHPLMAMDCIRYLSYECFQSKQKRETAKYITTWRFLNYASFFWSRHAHVRKDVQLSIQIHQFLKSSPRVYLSASFNYPWTMGRSDLKTRQGFEIAAFYGFIDELKEFMEDTDSAETLKNTCRALHCAVKGNQSTAIEVLLDLGADIEGTDNFGYTPLLIAITSKALEAATKLIQRGANVMALTKQPYDSAISLIRSVPVAPYLNVLLEAGAIVRTEDIFQYMTLMHVLVEADDIDTAENFFKRHALNHKMENRTVSETLLIVSQRGYTKWVEMLLYYGADVDKTCQHVSSMFSAFRTPLMLALEGCYEECSLALLRWGADVNYQDPDGITALHIAIASGSLSVTDQLIKNHASVDTKSRPIYTVKLEKGGGWYSQVSNSDQKLKVDIDEKIIISMFTTFTDAEKLKYELRRLKLLEMRAWKDGMTALDIARLKGNEEIIRLLESLGSPESDFEPIPVDNCPFQLVLKYLVGRNTDILS